MVGALACSRSIPDRGALWRIGPMSNLLCAAPLRGSSPHRCCRASMPVEKSLPAWCRAARRTCYSPRLSQKGNVRQGAMSVEALCQAIVEVSDNTAAVLLMRSVGGPAGLTQFIRDLGDTVTRSDRYEPESNRYSGVLDTTTPQAITRSAQKNSSGRCPYSEIT
jgi:hypothetical protein